MKKLLSILLVLTMGPALIAGLQSCDTCGSDNEDYVPIFFKLKDGTSIATFYKADTIDYLVKRYTENDTIPTNTPIKAEFKFNTERVAFAEPSKSLNLMGTLLACSPALPEYPKPTQFIVKVDLVSKYNYGSTFKSNDTINQFALVETKNSYSYSGGSFKNLSEAKGDFANNTYKFIVTPLQPNTEVSPFQLEAIIILSDGTVVKATSPKVYLGI